LDNLQADLLTSLVIGTVLIDSILPCYVYWQLYEHCNLFVLVTGDGYTFFSNIIFCQAADDLICVTTLILSIVF